MTTQSHSIDRLLQEAKLAIQSGDRRRARRLAESAVKEAPQREESWLLLASIASPRASVRYVQRALDINPRSRLARRAMQWALKRARSTGEFYQRHRPRVLFPKDGSALVKARPAFLPWAGAVIVMLFGVVAWFGMPSLPVFAQNSPPLAAANKLAKATYTPTSTPTFTPTPTPTNTPTPTPTPTLTPTFTPRPTHRPTNPPPPPKPPSVNLQLPPGVKPGERWVEVDLSEQRAYANQGTQRLRTFIVSTGTYLHPTVTGTFRIYVKYRYADMAGPGYYLPNVPYVMYFYRGYGLHGTYWHNNFGTPMSHGCVNFTISDAAWLFNFASVGTVVHIHP